jgi:hypothetical protein
MNHTGIVVSHDGQELGPYTLEEVRAGLQAGQLREDDWAWDAGANQWVPLAQVLQAAAPAAQNRAGQGAAPAPGARAGVGASGGGKSTKWLVVGGAAVVVLVAGGLIWALKPGGSNKPSPTGSSPATSPLTQKTPLFRVQKGGKAGYINKEGQVVIPITLPAGAGEFSEGLALVKAPDGFYFIDETGKTRFSLGRRCTSVLPFSEGLAAVGSDKMGYVDTQGREVIKARFLMAFSFREGFARAEVAERQDSFIDKTGQIMFPQYRAVSLGFSDGLAAVKPASQSYSEGKTGYINRAGELVIPMEYDSLWECHEGVVFVAKNGDKAESYQNKEGVLMIETPSVITGLNTNGQVVIRGNFWTVRPFSEGLAAARVRDRWGYIDHAGKWAIPLKFDECAPFSQGLAGVKLDGKWGFIDKTGAVVIPLGFVLPADWEKRRDRLKFRDGLAMVPEGSKVGYIDRAGNWLWPPAE